MLKALLGVAENKIGSIEEVSMGEWINTKDRVSIEGKTHYGKHFELTLTIAKEPANEDS
jgi:hypothetical protein